MFKKREGFWKGKKHSVETRLKMGLSHKGKKMPPRTDEWRRKQSLAHKGQITWAKGNHWKLNEATKKKMSVSKKGVKFSEEHKINLSKPKTEEHKKKMSEVRKGEKNYNWMGGYEEFKKRDNEKYRNNMEKLAGRPRTDACEICGIPEKDLKRHLCFDHDHKTGKFRGWICHRCNTILGLGKDNVEIFKSIINYLELNNK